MKAGGTYEPVPNMDNFSLSNKKQIAKFVIQAVFLLTYEKKLGHNKMKVYLLILMVFFLVADVDAGMTAKSTAHRLYGKWAWTVAKNNCTEVYEYRPDNTSTVHSGEEIAESHFTISDQPDPKGFYRMTDEIISSNHQTGCDGAPGGSPVGDKATNYVIFHPTEELMLICGEPDMASCFGPLRRIS